MIQSEHISRDDLLEMLQSEVDTDKTRTIGAHLHQCESCRQALDALSARPEIWNKTPELLKDQPVTRFFANSEKNEHTTDLPRSGQENFDDSEWKQPLDGILDPPKHPEMIGRIGKYDLEREVGRGGMGVVFKAHDAELNRPLAIKVLAPHLASHGTARKRFAQEARAAAGVLHPNVIAVHDVNNEGKTPFIVMQYIAGPSLQKLVDENGPLSEIEIVSIALQIAAGLTPAHARGLVHRDIKPANILIEQGVSRVVITDFGLARAEDDASLTRTGWLTGTPNYMSPEQARGERLDHRSDLFSLGSLIYFLATGRLPFRAESPLGVLTRIQNESPTPVRQINHQISKTLADIIEVLLRKNADERFQSAGELHNLLEQHLAHLHQPDVAKPPKVASSKPSNSNWKPIAAVLVCLGILGGGYFGIQQWPNLFSFNEPNRQTQEDESSGPSGLIVKETNKESSIQESPTDEDVVEDRIIYSIGDYRGHRDGHKEFDEGIKLFNVKKYDEAIVKFKAAAKHDRYQAKSIYNIACIYALQGKSEAAIKDLNRAADLGFNDPDHFRCDEDLKSLRSEKGFETLLEKLDTMNKAQKLVDSAHRLIDEKSYKKMESLCREALKLDSKNESAFLHLGYALHMQGKLKEAMPWHERTARSRTQSSLGYYNICCVHALNGKTEQALQNFDRAIEAGLAQRLDLEEIQEDSDLESLRDNERFKQACEEIKSLQKSRHSGLHISVQGTSVSMVDAIPIAIDDPDSVKGDWECILVRNRVDLTISKAAKDKKWKWGYSTHFKSTDFSPELTKDSTEFRLKRKFGDLVFKGSFDGRKGKGTFQFEGSEKYRRWLEEQGIKDAPNALLFRLFMSWENEKQIVANLQELQKLGLDKKSLQTLMIHGVDAKLVKKYQKADLAVADHLIFIVWRVKPSLIQDYNRAGLDLKKHQRFINRRVPAKLLQAYNQAELDLEEHKEFINWRVEPKLLTQYKDAGLALEEYKKFINRRVGPKLIRDYQKAGFDVKKFEDFIGWRVEPKLLKQYESAGLDVRKHQRLVQQRIPPSLIKEYKDADFDLKEYREYLRSRVDVKLLKDYRKADMLNAKYKTFIRMHVPAKLLREYKDAGYEPTKYRTLIQIRIPASLLKRYEKADLDIDEHMEFIKRRMSPEKVLEYLKKRKSKK